VGGVTSVRTFHPRRGRCSARHRDALDRLLPVYGVDLDGGPVSGSPLVLEIGSGMGEATLAMAAADPSRGYLAAEIHTPGVANLLACVSERGLTNVRVVFGDALTLLRNRIGAGTLDAIHAFFPDPWPKTRHHKRRLIQPRHVALLSSRLRANGILWCATDWADYADAMVATMSADPLLLPALGPRPARPTTKFEQRAIDEGRAVHDLIFQRR
jgi:tRNA (guanine-N7-)-methyltransferase